MSTSGFIDSVHLVTIPPLLFVDNRMVSLYTLLVFYIQRITVLLTVYLRIPFRKGLYSWPILVRESLQFRFAEGRRFSTAPQFPPTFLNGRLDITYKWQKLKWGIKPCNMSHTFLHIQVLQKVQLKNLKSLFIRMKWVSF